MQAQIQRLENAAGERNAEIRFDVHVMIPHQRCDSIPSAQSFGAQGHRQPASTVAAFLSGIPYRYIDELNGRIAWRRFRHGRTSQRLDL
jgi:hypothetical protein